jgi:FkbM family methyltransferase
MEKYLINQPLKTKTLNLIRRIFKQPIFEKAIVENIKNNPGTFWEKLVPPDYLYSKGSMREVVREGIHYSLDISNVVDHHIYFCFKDSNYESIKDVIQKSAVILDIGANIGITAMYFSKLNTGANIIAFEPHPHTYERAMQNLSKNDFRNIDFRMMGLGEKKERLKLYEVNPNNPGMNRIIPGQQNFPYVEIFISTLDEFVREQNIDTVDFVKIDVEGFEYSVIKGGENTLRKYKPVLFIELDDNNLRENNSSAAGLISLLTSYGYTQLIRADNHQPLSTSADFSNCHYDIIAK